MPPAPSTRIRALVTRSISSALSAATAGEYRGARGMPILRRPPRGAAARWRPHLHPPVLAPGMARALVWTCAVRRGAAAVPSPLTARQFSCTRSRSAPPLSRPEYQLRVGACVRVLRKTLPDFMAAGLVEKVSLSEAPAMRHLLGVRDTSRADEPEKIYHNYILFQVGPMPMEPGGSAAAAAEPADKDQRWSPQLSFQGRRAYLLSAEALRYTLHACFTDTEVRIEHLSFTRQALTPAAARPGVTPGDELVIRLRFRGKNRVTSTIQDYTVIFRYRFDRESGTICEHMVEKIMPLPGQRAWQSFADMRSRLA